MFWQLEISAVDVPVFVCNLVGGVLFEGAFIREANATGNFIERNQITAISCRRRKETGQISAITSF